MRVVYLIGFSIDGSSGKNKATSEKVRVLKSKIGDKNFSFYTNKRQRSIIFKLIGNQLFDFYVFRKLLFHKNNFIVIQRVFFMPMTRFLLFIKGVKVVSEFHADFKDEIPHLNKSKFQRFILKLIAPIYTLNYKLSHGIIYNHPILKEKFDSRFKVPSIYSYNGSNYNQFIPVDKSFSREKVKIKEDEIAFLFLGSVSKWHGVDYLIDIFNEKIIQENNNISLYIVGAAENSYVNEIKQKINNKNIKLIPPVDTNFAINYINASDYCLLPVKQIRISPGSPLKLYDYISCGKPVIAQSNVRGYSDEVEKYNLGYTMDLTNSNTSAIRIIKIINEKQDFSENNRAVAMNDLSWEKRIEKWLNFIYKLNK